jgi:hypothetical protein
VQVPAAGRLRCARARELVEERPDEVRVRAACADGLAVEERDEVDLALAGTGEQTPNRASPHARQRSCRRGDPIDKELRVLRVRPGVRA